MRSWSWDGRESQLATDDEAVRALRTAIAHNDYCVAPVNAGQGVSELVTIEPAAAVIRWLCGEAGGLLSQHTQVTSTAQEDHRRLERQ